MLEVYIVMLPRHSCGLMLFAFCRPHSRKIIVKNDLKVVIYFGSPNRIRTGVLALKGRCPGPLDDGAKTAKTPANYNRHPGLCQGFYAGITCLYNMLFYLDAATGSVASTSSTVSVSTTASAAGLACSTSTC